MGKVAVFAASLLLAGCASITSESTQLVRVDALDEQGDPVPEAKCELANDRGVYKADAGSHVQIAKSGQNLAIKCTSDSRSDAAEGTAISRAGAGMYGNILFGGGIGAIIDHSRGTAYKYPEWMQLVFGKILVFDRTEHKDGVPMAGKAPDADQADKDSQVAAAAPEYN